MKLLFLGESISILFTLSEKTWNIATWQNPKCAVSDDLLYLKQIFSLSIFTVFQGGRKCGFFTNSS